MRCRKRGCCDCRALAVGDLGVGEKYPAATAHAPANHQQRLHLRGRDIVDVQRDGGGGTAHAMLGKQAGVAARRVQQRGQDAALHDARVVEVRSLRHQRHAHQVRLPLHDGEIQRFEKGILQRVRLACGGVVRHGERGTVPVSWNGRHDSRSRPAAIRTVSLSRSPTGRVRCACCAPDPVRRPQRWLGGHRAHRQQPASAQHPCPAGGAYRDGRRVAEQQHQHERAERQRADP